MPYIGRVIDAELRARLAAAGAVLIEGPKACGKTASAREVAASEVLLDVDRSARDAVAVAPELVLDGATPRLLDEWQVAPDLWNHVRRAVDARGGPGQFILTGSAVPADDATRHTGGGRIARLRMRPMSLFELGESSGALSLGALLATGPEPARSADLTVPRVAELIAVGGWPANRTRAGAAALQFVRDYLEDVRRTDIDRVDGTRRDPLRVGRLLAALARNIGTPASLTLLARETQDAADGQLTDATAAGYLAALARLMVVEDLPAWAPHLRARARLRTSAVRHFVDPSLAVAALRASPQRLLADLNWLGFLFESLVIRDLRVYAQANDASVLHYRDNTGLEVDAIVETVQGDWAAFEVKLGHGQIDAAAATLLRFAAKIDTTKCGVPKALGVIVPGGYGHVRPDGVAVIPIDSLRP
jgi:predicted AAA+ superfamily ATPase